ncbi:MAG: sigma-70 family RNA polymerase sigma factor [Pseudonocardiaceae bacterium]
MNDEPHLTRCALRAAHGDRSAAETFIRHTQQSVWRMLTHLTSRDVAEDLTQETYARAFTALPRFRGNSSARTWLLAIARRVAADHLRQRRTRPTLVETTDWQRRAEHSQPRLPELDEGAALRQAMGSLTTERREAFVLTQITGLSYAEAAQVCGCRIGTIRSRVARARDDLRSALGSATDNDAATR